MSSSYRDLRVWQQAMKLAVQVYQLTENLPKHELYGLTAQIRRAAISFQQHRGRERAPNKP